MAAACASLPSRSSGTAAEATAAAAAPISQRRLRQSKGGTGSAGLAGVLCSSTWSRMQEWELADILDPIGVTALAEGVAHSGRPLGRNPYYDGSRTDHFDGRVFFNPGGVPPGRLPDFLKWQFGGGRARWP